MRRLAGLLPEQAALWMQGAPVGRTAPLCAFKSCALTVPGQLRTNPPEKPPHKKNLRMEKHPHGGFLF